MNTWVRSRIQTGGVCSGSMLPCAPSLRANLWFSDRFHVKLSTHTSREMRFLGGSLRFHGQGCFACAFRQRFPFRRFVAVGSIWSAKVVVHADLKGGRTDLRRCARSGRLVQRACVHGSDWHAFPIGFHSCNDVCAADRRVIPPVLSVINDVTVVPPSSGWIDSWAYGNASALLTCTKADCK